MNKIHLKTIYTVVILLLCLTTLVGMAFHPTKVNIGNQALPDLPKAMTDDGRINTGYLQELSDWYDGRFAFRPEIIAVNSALYEKLFSESSSDEIIVGSDDWLYYSATLDDFQHRNPISERMLFNIAHNVALMQEYAEGQGVKFLFTIAPNKNSLYPDKMPDRYRIAVEDKSDVERLVPWLKEEEVNYLDLFGLFEESDDVLYYKRDSHWTEDGAILVYQKLLEKIGRDGISFPETPASYTGVNGDLDKMLYPTGGISEDKKVYLSDASWYYIGEADDVEDDYIETEQSYGKGSLLMYRDSFGNSMLPYMAETFGKAAFSKIVPYDMDDLYFTGADTMIIERVERHLPTLGNVAPIMKAPVRHDIRPEDLIKADTEEYPPEVAQTSDGWYYRISGSLPEIKDLKARILVSAGDEDKELYEAFCISGTDGAYGYQACIPVEDISGDIGNIKIYIYTEGEL